MLKSRDRNIQSFEDLDHITFRLYLTEKILSFPWEHQTVNTLQGKHSCL